jgi:cytochrome c oxidase assembly protein subunit 15
MLIAGVVADAILGAFVVYSKLNPWLVSLHMLLSLSMIVISAVLYHRSKYVYGPGARSDVRDRHFLLIARLLWIPFAVLLITGTITTGSGPHAGASQGQLVARRLPFAFSSAAWVHSLAAVLFIGLVTGLLLAQAAIGVTQYLTHVPPLLVELHVVGAVSLTIGVTQFHLRQSAHDREPGTRRVERSAEPIITVL